MFTDNQNPVNLIALDMKTGETVAATPVIDELPEDVQVSVENSAIVYDDGAGTVSTIVCNMVWCRKCQPWRRRQRLFHPELQKIFMM